MKEHALKVKSSREIIETLPSEVVKALKSVSEEAAKSAYKEMVAEEWKRAKFYYLLRKNTSQKP